MIPMLAKLNDPGIYDQEVLDQAVEDLTERRSETLMGPPGGLSLDGAPAPLQGGSPGTDPRDALDLRIQDHTQTLKELAAEAKFVEQRYSRRAQKSTPASSQKPYLSQLFVREFERCR
eukprot:CAMPEP_0115727166 /NCGR_PEP_ID=MMETSP0272-20121206/82279_1 /TAXON_ID=71861 /ORGANISM="Scrippsiella trochoidea, Strain CCMP3099" /LENGTH=117 /DNA_ID=CAMNT_0003170663 /DNA_START=1 /DNA_END=350 /DNA_ORIENTATION=-